MSQVSDQLTVNSVQARKALLQAFKVKRPVFLWGPPGIGKSEVVSDITDELGGYMVDLRMAQMEPTDIRGIPYFNKENGKMDWAEPVDLPSAELAAQYPIVVLFLDEMNSAPPAVQAPRLPASRPCRICATARGCCAPWCMTCRCRTNPGTL